MVYGDGVYREETRGVRAFTGVSLDLGMIATITAGQPQQVVLSGDENILQYVKLDVNDAGVLVASASADIRPRIPLRLTAQAALIVAAYAKGESHLEVLEASAPSFTVGATDHSEVHLEGAGGDALDATVSGASHLDARGYHVAGADLTLSAGSQAEVWVQAPGTLAGDVSGGSAAEVVGGGTCGVALHDTSTCQD